MQRRHNLGKSARLLHKKPDVCDISLSFSDPTASLNTDMFARTEPTSQATFNTEYSNTVPNTFDHSLVNLKAFVPKKCEKILKGVNKIAFMFELVEGSAIEIINVIGNTTILKIPVHIFEEFPFDSTSFNRSEIVFILNKESFRKKQKIKQGKKFKEAIDKNSKFEEEDLFKSLRDRYIDFQIKNKVNFVFIDDSETFHSQIRSMVTLTVEKNTYAPKTKKFLESEKSEFLKSVLESILGVSKSVASAIIEKYSDMKMLLDGLKMKEAFLSIKITDENGSRRNIPEKIHQKLVKAFQSTDPNEKIQ